MAELERRGIETRLSFPPIHIQPYYVERFGYRREDFPITYDAWSGLIDLPVWPGMDEAVQDYVIESVIDVCENPRIAYA